MSSEGTSKWAKEATNLLSKTTVSTVADKELKQTYCGLYYKTSQIPFSENRRKFKEKFTDQFSRQLFFSEN